MNKEIRSYLDMQLEEASLESGRYNTDFDIQNPAPAGPTALLNAFRTTAARLGADFNRPARNSMSWAGLKRNSQN